VLTIYTVAGQLAFIAVILILERSLGAVLN